MGLSLPSFYALLHALGVPLITLDPALPPIIRTQSLRLALLAISRIGSPNFSVPDGSTLSLPPDSPSYTNLIIELLFSRACAGHPITRSEASSATASLTRYLLDTLSKLQSDATASALSDAYASSQDRAPNAHTFIEPPEEPPPKAVKCPPPTLLQSPHSQARTPSSTTSHLTPWATPSETPHSASPSSTPGSSKTSVPPTTGPAKEPPAS